jgi:acyl-coenzyme A synthetase/AMP-(fatty) acid ligase
MRRAPAAGGPLSDGAMNNWFDHILYHIRTQPETPAMVMEDRVVTYGMLGQAMEHCAQRIAALDFPREGVVAVIVANPIRHVTLCLALFRLGIRSLSLAVGQLNVAIEGLVLALGDREACQRRGTAQRVVEVTDAWFAEEPPCQELPAGFADATQICRLFLTSGTTGAPKVVQFNVADMGEKGASLLVGSRASRRLCLPGLSSALGFWTASGVLTGGGTLCFSESPYQSIRMIELFSIEHIMAATEQVLALARVARTQRARLPSLRLVDFGGGVPSRALLEAAMFYLCHDIQCSYGASEAGPIARAPARDVLARPGLVGQVLPDVEVAIVDADEKPCAVGTVGLVRCRRNPRWSGADEKWIDLGDIGWITEGSELFIIGRAADLGTRAGEAARQVSPAHEAEHLLRLEWDATDAAAVEIAATPPQLVIATVDCADAKADAFEAVLRRRGFDYAVRIVPVPAIPRGVSGKINRAELKALLVRA